MEELYTRISNLLTNKSRPLVYICGLGGSGKTTLAKEIAEKLDTDSVAVHSDWWAKYSTTERKKRIGDALASNDPERIEQEENPQNWYDVWESIRSDLLTLQETGSLIINTAWNQQTGEKDFTVELSVPEHGVILFDGIYLLHPEIADIADLIVFLDVHPEECQKRSEQRDAHRSEPEYLAYKAALMQKYDIPYFEKYRERADIVLSEES